LRNDNHVHASAAIRSIASKDTQGAEAPGFDCIALLLQGGGALGAYQAGVYEALTEAQLYPDWVAGISVGAINAALIAGNPRRRASRNCVNSGRPSRRRQSGASTHC